MVSSPPLPKRASSRDEPRIGVVVGEKLVDRGVDAVCREVGDKVAVVEGDAGKRAEGHAVVLEEERRDRPVDRHRCR